MSELGKRIALARKSAELTQVGLAEKLNCESITVSRWERGITTPSLSTLRRISVITKTPLSNFVANEGAPDVILDELRLLRDSVEKIEGFLTQLTGGRR